MHLDYLKSGSDIITANTFGANILKFDGKNGRYSLEEIISSALKKTQKTR
ncbi:MAG: homocysteine S-methyltransferase family protein [Clostridiales bacterium]|nr:MAG: homocysteine S-methyltransferase family protein [Clostridiales bacterium]